MYKLTHKNISVLHAAGRGRNNQNMIADSSALMQRLFIENAYPKNLATLISS